MKFENSWAFGGFDLPWLRRQHLFAECASHLIIEHISRLGNILIHYSSIHIHIYSGINNFNMSRPRRSAQLKNYATLSSDDENNTQIGVTGDESASENLSLRDIPEVSIYGLLEPDTMTTQLQKDPPDIESDPNVCHIQHDSP
jgi:hypothetical protein